MTTERRNQMMAVAVQLEALAQEVGELSDGFPVLTNLEFIAIAHEISAAAIRIKVLRATVPDV